MYAIAFDLVVSDTQENHPKGTSAAYAESSQEKHAKLIGCKKGHTKKEKVAIQKGNYTNGWVSDANWLC
jgi:hypothetical protein